MYIYIAASSKFVLMAIFVMRHAQIGTRTYTLTSHSESSPKPKKKKGNKAQKTKPKDRNELFTHDPLLETESANFTVPIKTYSARPFDCKCIPRDTLVT